MVCTCGCETRTCAHCDRASNTPGVCNKKPTNHRKTYAAGSPAAGALPAAGAAAVGSAALGAGAADPAGAFASGLARGGDSAVASDTSTPGAPAPAAGALPSLSLAESADFGLLLGGSGWRLPLGRRLSADNAVAAGDALGPLDGPRNNDLNYKRKRTTCVSDNARSAAAINVRTMSAAAGKLFCNFCFVSFVCLRVLLPPLSRSSKHGCHMVLSSAGSVQQNKSAHHQSLSLRFFSVLIVAQHAR